MTLGEKIKEARKKKKLTQAHLAGDRITRNMICLIEKDAANPSIETLRYIAHRLNLPLSYLVSDTDDVFYFAKKEALEGILTAYTSKNYTVAISRAEKLEKTDDELAYILSDSYFNLGKKALLGGSLVTAKKHLDKAVFYCEKTCYNTERIKALTAMYSALAKNIGAPLLEFDTDFYLKLLNSSFDLEFYNYITLNYDYKYKNPIFKNHIQAKKNMKERDYSAAANLLAEVDAAVHKTEYNAYVIFSIYSDLEICCKQLGDFERAYKYSSKRFSLLEGFKA